jgi:F-type H+-transporting ATPase subunit b
VGADHGDPHAADAHGAEHGDDHGGHHDPTEFYLGDNDHDGVPNWRDPSENGEPRGMSVIFDAEDAYFVPEIAFHALNLLIVVLLLWRFAARPLGDALKNRALSIRKQLADAAAARDEARRRNEEVSTRLAAFEQELAQMRTTAAAEARADAEQLVKRAEAEAERIRQTAERNINEELRRARASLREEAVDLAVQLARATLTREVQADDQRRLAREFLDSLTQDGDRTHG